MKNEDKDLRKEIEDLENLIAEVKKQHEEEKKKLRMNLRSQPRKVVKINLAVEYSNDPLINLVVGFLINFILLFVLVNGLHLAEAANNYVFLLVALAFTVYESLLKWYLIKKQPSLVIYSQGVIFFLANLVFFYLLDLVVLVKSFTFVSVVTPILFVFLFQTVRVFIKNLYAVTIHKISVRIPDKK